MQCRQKATRIPGHDLAPLLRRAGRVGADVIVDESLIGAAVQLGDRVGQVVQRVAIDVAGAGLALKDVTAIEVVGVGQRMRRIDPIDAAAGGAHPAKHAIEAVVLHHQDDDVVDWHGGAASCERRGSYNAPGVGVGSAPSEAAANTSLPRTHLMAKLLHIVFPIAADPYILQFVAVRGI
jgi:hypothetical protein